MNFDRRRGLIVWAAALFVVLLTAGIVAASVGSGHPRPRVTAEPLAAAPAISPDSTQAWKSVPPLTDVPPDTPVQQQYDTALTSGLAASSSVQAAEAAQVPPPGFSTAWPALPVADTPERWAGQFTRAMLDIDFARQSRTGLGSWLSAEEAPELLAGVPGSVADKVLYLSLFDTTALGGSSSPIPDASSWQAAARADERWTVSDLVVQADPQFSQIVANGWQPVDERFTVEDVTGNLTTTRGTSNTTKRFSMAVYIGSAHWHDGYGTVLVGDWKES